MENLIEPNLEFIEIINAFPIVKLKLEELKFDLSDVIDGISMETYFMNKNFTDEEFTFLLRKLNFDLKKHLRTNSDSESTCLNAIIASASTDSHNCYEAEEEEE